MTISSVKCPVLGANVTRVTDLDAQTTKVICPEYEQPTGTCRLRNGPAASQFSESGSEGALRAQHARCALWAA